MLPLATPDRAAVLGVGGRDLHRIQAPGNLDAGNSLVGCKSEDHAYDVGLGEGQIGEGFFGDDEACTAAQAADLCSAPPECAALNECI